jgi:dTDP-4-amino-4,6-dideoxygalactose transaminase
MSIPIMKPRLPGIPRISHYLNKVQEAQIYSNQGPLVGELESRLSEHFEVSKAQVVMCTNATLGLMGAIFTTHPKDFLAPVYTFPASLLALHHSGKRMKILDVSMDTWEIDEKLIGRLEADSWGVLRVLPFGAPIDFDKFMNFGSVVIDAAASFGSEPSSLSKIPENTCVVYSFHATKVLGMGEGACVVFGSPSQAREFRSWINFGFNGDRQSLTLGINAKMSEYTAAVGLAAFDEWGEEKSEWSSVHARARSIDESFGLLSLPGKFGGVSPYWIVEFDEVRLASRAIARFNESEIGVRRWWDLGCHKMPAFKSLIRGEFPNTDQIANRTFGLPCFRDMSDEDFSQIRSVLASL